MSNTVFGVIWLILGILYMSGVVEVTAGTTAMLVCVGISTYYATRDE